MSDVLKSCKECFLRNMLTFWIPCSEGAEGHNAVLEGGRLL